MLPYTLTQLTSYRQLRKTPTIIPAILVAKIKIMLRHLLKATCSRFSLAGIVEASKALLSKRFYAGSFVHLFKSFFKTFLQTKLSFQNNLTSKQGYNKPQILTTGIIMVLMQFCYCDKSELSQVFPAR